MKIFSHYALILLFSCTIPTSFIHTDEQDAHHRSRSGSLIEATSLAQLQSIIANNENVVVDFYATWCGPCQRMGPIFGQLPAAFQNQNIVFVKINIDLAGSAYGIRMLPTIVCFQNQKEISRSSGFKPFNDLSNYIKGVYKI